MKIFVEMTAYQAAPVIEAAIRSSINHVDGVIVVDGSCHGPSTDDTAAIARSFGDKVKLIQGAFAKADGAWDERLQRDTAIAAMPKGDDHWCLIQDADEVFDDENMNKLKWRLKFLPALTKVVSFLYVQFWHDVRHVRVGDEWDVKPMHTGAFRLTEGVHQTGFLNFGDAECPDWNNAQPPTAIIFRDIVCFHYGHAMAYERRRMKVIEAYNAGYAEGEETETLDAYLGRFERTCRKSEAEWLRPYDSGYHPAAIRPLIGVYFK